MQTVQRFADGRRSILAAAMLGSFLAAGFAQVAAPAAAPPGSTACVTVLDNPLDPDNPVKDLLVNHVQDMRYAGSLIFWVGVNSDSGLTGSVVLNERNFDLLPATTAFESVLTGSWADAWVKDFFFHVQEASLMFGAGVNTSEGTTGSLQSASQTPDSR